MGVSTVPQNQPPTAELLGVPISQLSMDQTIEWFEERIQAKKPGLVITADATALVIARENPSFSAVLAKADLITADSAGILWALRRNGVTNPPKVSGVELVDKLTALSAQKGYRLFYLGSAPGVTDVAAERMRLRWPGCNIVGTRHGFFPATDDEVVAQEIAATQPDILFVAMGMPRQEEFILKTLPIIGALGMGVGGSFDVYSGKTKRAPKWMQRAHLEWLWRLALNPTKIAKVKKLPQFVWMILRGAR